MRPLLTSGRMTRRARAESRPLALHGLFARRVTRGVALLVVAALLDACGGQADPQHELDSVVSWTATMRLAAAEYRTGAITSTYARQLDREATDALAEARRELRLEGRDPITTTRSRAAVDSLAAAIRALSVEAPR